MAFNVYMPDTPESISFYSNIPAPLIDTVIGSMQGVSSAYFYDFIISNSNTPSYPFTYYRVYLDPSIPDVANIIADVGADNDIFRYNPKHLDNNTRYSYCRKSARVESIGSVAGESYQFDWNTAEQTISIANGYNVYIVRSTIALSVNGDPEYDPRIKDELFFNKDPDADYTMVLGCRTTSDSDFEPSYDNIYTTKAYNVNIYWDSPVTGTRFNVPISNGQMRGYAMTTLISEGIEYFLYSATTENSPIFRALRMPIGKFTNDELPRAYADLTDVPSIISVSLQWLKQQASTQAAGVTDQDLFTEIHAQWLGASSGNVYADIVCDYSSLIGSDVDIGGYVPPEDINQSPDIDDDNIYTTSISLTTPTLSANGVFNRCYVLNANVVNSLNNYLYNSDEGIFEELIRNVFTQGNPLESLIDLRLYPFDVKNHTGALSIENIVFGRADTGIRAYVMPNNANCVVSLGSCNVVRRWHNFLDYDTQAELYIPFCGVTPIPIEKILNKTVSIYLIIDFVTGSGCAVVYADNLPILYRQAVIGVSIPMTATNSSEYAKAIMGNLIQTGMSIAGAASGNVSGLLASTMQLSDTIMTGSHVQQIGASSPQTSLYQPKNAYLMLSYSQPIPEVWDDTYADLIGYACETPMSHIGDARGFSAFDNIKMTISGATESEKTHILDLLKNGVYM